MSYFPRASSTHHRTETETTLSPTVSIPFPPIPTNTIPSTHQHRTIVLCFDGTGDQFDRDNSNVIEFFSMLKKDDRTQQIVYYQPGIGTYLGRRSAPGLMMTTIGETWDQAVAWNLACHVQDGYHFLMQNYINGDKIALLGFSRGAYTARALAGMLHKVGLLPPGNAEQVPFAYKMFVQKDKESWRAADQFKESFAIDVKIDFLGVWDTVRSVGLFDICLPFSTSNNSIRAFRHALALDERRTKFQANHWNSPGAEDASLGSQYEDDLTDVKEVWFAGVHTDIGGGSVMNGTSHSLAKITLRWMIKECFRCQTGIMFDTNKLYKRTGLTPYHLSTSVLNCRQYEDPDTFLKDTPGGSCAKDLEVYEREHVDCLQRSHDQLAVKLMWWVLEYLPLQQMLPGTDTQGAPFSRVKRFFRQHPFNRGRGRKVPLCDSEDNRVPIFVHYTVYERMLDKEYIPKARNWAAIKNLITWTD